jgi:hypothetical protein
MEDLYEEYGGSRSAYLRYLAEEYGVDLSTVTALADVLGPNEDFDGLVTTLEDMC